MEITRDEVKRRSNLAKHGLDFAQLDISFFEAARVYEGKQERLIAVGRFSDAVVLVVFKPLGAEAISIISMRPANRRERWSDHG